MDDILLHLSQFGAAGLIGLLWVLERRHAAARDRQLDEAHRRILERQREADVLIAVVRDNTRAVAALRAGQERLVDLLHVILQVDQRRPAGARLSLEAVERAACSARP